MKFEEKRVLKLLEGLSISARVAFASTCAERFLPAYRAYHDASGSGDPAALETIASLIWEGVAKKAKYPARGDLVGRTMALLVDESAEGPWVLRAAADDAATAVVYASRCWKSGLSQEAAWAARRVYEALDRAVISRTEMDMNAPGASDAVLSDPLIQGELERQIRDLGDLTNTTDEDFQVTVSRLRKRAKVEAGPVLKALLEIASLPGR